MASFGIGDRRAHKLQAVSVGCTVYLFLCV